MKEKKNRREKKKKVEEKTRKKKGEIRGVVCFNLFSSLLFSFIVSS